MTSKIKVDNINKVSDDSNIINKCGTTITLGASGDSIALASGASQTGFGRTGTVDWITTPKTATFTAVSGEGYFCNTSGGAFTVNLPAGSAGAIVSVADYAGTWDTGNLTVSPNGSDKIGGVNASVILSTEGQSVTLVFVDSTQGWINTMDSTSNVRGNPNLIATGGTVTTSGDCKIHTFTGPGTFSVSNTSVTAANNIVSYLVVAGGGGGAHDDGGGGGAGGFREYKGPATPYTASPLNGNPCGTAVTLTATSYPITVGGGGAGAVPGSNCTACNGSNSIFSTITSAGGGFGSRTTNAGPGGSGGGADVAPRSAGSGNTPPTTPAQGTNGGAGTPGGNAGGGGGGATVAGTAGSGSAPSSSGGPGGTGGTTSISASPTAYAGGGGGGGFGSPGSGGTGGGGAGGLGSAQAGNGTANTGGGGGGYGTDQTSGNGAGAGGSGIVIIRYKFQ